MTWLRSDAPLFLCHWWMIRAVLLLLALGIIALSWLVPPASLLLLVACAVGVVLTLRFPVAGFCLLAFSVPWGSGTGLLSAGSPLTSTDLIVAAIGLVWLSRAAFAGRNPIAVPLWVPYIGMFVLALVLSSSQAADKHAATNEILKWLEMAVVYCAGSQLLRDRRDLFWTVGALVAAGVTQALLGFAQFAFQLGPQAFTHGVFLRAYGSFDQPNPYAGYLNMILPFALALSVRGQSSRVRSSCRLASFILVGALLASESRGALLATGLAVVTVGVLVWPQVTRRVWSGLVATLLAAWMASVGLVPTGPFVRLLTAVGLGGVSFGSVNNANFSAIERAAHWLAGVRMFSAHPLLGVGIGNYAVAYPLYHPRGWYAALAHAHNYYINIAAETGIIGLIAYILLAGSALWYSYAVVRRARDPLGGAVVIGTVGALVATDFHNLFDVLYVHGMVALVGMLVALVPVSYTVSNLRTSIDG